MLFESDIIHHDEKINGWRHAGTHRDYDCVCVAPLPADSIHTSVGVNGALECATSDTTSTFVPSRNRYMAPSPHGLVVGVVLTDL